MTPTELEQERRQANIVNVNLVGTFLLFLMLPYIFFFGLLMILTGQIDIILLYQSVMDNNSMVVFKGWVIGFFTIVSVSAFFLTAYRTEKYITDRFKQVPPPEKKQRVGGSVPTHYIIESDGAVEASEETEIRMNELNDVIDDREK